MYKINRYQNGEEVQPIDYSSYGFLRPETLQQLFTDNSQQEFVPETKPQTELQPEESDQPDELSLVKEQNDILQKTLEAYQGRQAEVDDDLEMDNFMNFISSDDNLPIDPDEMEASFYEYKQGQFQSIASDVMSNSGVTPKQYLEAIFGNEKGKTGQNTNLKGTATGRYQIVEGTRKSIYNKHFKDKMSYADFDNAYKTNADFEQSVAESLAQDNINSSSNLDEAFGKWYSPAHVTKGLWDVIPHPQYGNKLTLRQYVEKVKGTLRNAYPQQNFQNGGYIPTAMTPEEQYNGLNNPQYSEMLFNMEGYNTFRGLDNYEPVYIRDENDKERVLIGPNQTDKFYGKTYEQNLNYKRGGTVKVKLKRYY